MSAPFASIESMINTGVTATLTNAVATFNGGPAFGVVFDRASSEAFDSGAMTGARFTASFCAASAHGLVEGSSLTVNTVAYRVASGVEPDAGGWVTVDLIPG